MSAKGPEAADAIPYLVNAGLTQVRLKAVEALTAIGKQSVPELLIRLQKEPEDELIDILRRASLPWGVRSLRLASVDAMELIGEELPTEAYDWPMWRYSAERCATIPHNIPEELHLRWVRELPEPKRAWRPQRDDRGKLDFDVSYSPVAAEVDQVSVQKNEAHILAERGGPLKGAGQWTHQHHDEANTLLSQDDRVRLPLGVLWFGGPTNHNILGKHSRGPRPQVAGGRQVFLGVNTIAARCVFTGRELWERDFPDIGSFFDTTANLPGTSYIGSPFVTLPDSVYLRYKGQVHRMDAVTGETRAVYDIPGGMDNKDDVLDWGHISVHGDHLTVTSDPYKFEDQRPGGGSERYGHRPDERWNAARHRA